MIDKTNKQSKDLQKVKEDSEILSVKSQDLSQFVMKKKKSKPMVRVSLTGTPNKDNESFNAIKS